MARLLRTFVAFSCGPAVRAALMRQGDRLARIDPALRPPTTGDYHLTVQFLGNTREEDTARIGAALAQAVRDVEPFAVRYGGLGAFPSASRARVVWAAVREIEEAGHLSALARAVGEGLEPLGYPPEARAFHPHVTIGRVRRRPDPAFVQAVEGGAALDLGSETLSELRFILSEPGSRGYRYVDLTTVQLAGSHRGEAGPPGGGAGRQDGEEE